MGDGRAPAIIYSRSKAVTATTPPPVCIGVTVLEKVFAEAEIMSTA
jgi:hypothetical protein